MEFGKVSDLRHIEWTLPPDDEQTVQYFARLETIQNQTQFFIGTPAWGHKEWLGKIYPPKTKTADFLYHYARNFNCIELNTTHYRIPTQSQVESWTKQVPGDFLFCPKIPQLISHSETGLQDMALIAEWTGAVAHFKQNLGPCFLQLAPHFSYGQKNLLFRFLQLWPDELPLCIEFRHASWFEQNHVLPALVKYLQMRGIGLVITDVAGRRDVLHTSVSAPFTLIRFNGNARHPSDETRIKEWAGRLHRWQQMGLRKVFFIIHQPDDYTSPETAEMAVTEFNRTCEAHLHPLQWIG